VFDFRGGAVSPRTGRFRLEFELARIVPNDADITFCEASGGLGLDSRVSFTLVPWVRCNSITTAFSMASNDFTGLAGSISTEPEKRSG
jgi:hypothetical protein